MQNRHIILGAIFCALAFLRGTQAVVPAPDGCYPNFTTAEGCNALNALTRGLGNTGVGWYSLFSNTTGNFNTGVGAGALALNNTDNNTTGTDNTALEPTRLSITPTAPKTTPSAQMRSLVTSKVFSTTHMVVTRL